jgi:uncharacterized membrane protein
VITGYLVLKLIHVLSSTLLLGTGLGVAVLLFASYKEGHVDFLRTTANHVMIADWLIVAPAVVVQLVTGIWLTSYLGIPFGSAWFVAVLGLFFFAGACWLPMAWIQFQLSHLAVRDHEERVDDAAHSRDRGLMSIWACCAVLAFGALFALFWLMVFKHGMTTRLF